MAEQPEFTINRRTEPAKDEIQITLESEYARFYILGEYVGVTLKGNVLSSIHVRVSEVGRQAAALTWLEVALKKLPPEIRAELKLE